VLCPPSKTIPYSKIKSLIEKLVADAKLRARYIREIEFPLEEHYATYPVFPEEHEIGPTSTAD
jgi:hypothetical protein